MKFIKALQIVSDLATENALDEQTAKENNLTNMYAEQQKALETVESFIHNSIVIG